jgi:hypothetical protein
MRPPFLAAVFSASMAWTPPSSATAQQLTQQQTAFESLADSQWVRLAVLGVGRQEGRLLERTSDQVVLSAEPQPLRVPATTIDTLWTRGSAVKTGAIVGALTGLALGVGVGLLASETGEDISRTDAALILGGLGLGGGAILGTLTGLATPKWHRRYP